MGDIKQKDFAKNLDWKISVYHALPQNVLAFKWSGNIEQRRPIFKHESRQFLFVFHLQWRFHVTPYQIQFEIQLAVPS